MALYAARHLRMFLGSRDAAESARRLGQLGLTMVTAVMADAFYPDRLWIEALHSPIEPSLAEQIDVELERTTPGELTAWFLMEPNMPDPEWHARRIDVTFTGKIWTPLNTSSGNTATERVCLLGVTYSRREDETWTG